MNKLRVLSVQFLCVVAFLFGGGLTASAQTIESHVVSDFDGLASGNIYKLANGQYWEQTSYDLAYNYSINPTVIIYPGFIYWEMQIWNGSSLIGTVDVQQRRKGQSFDIGAREK